MSDEKKRERVRERASSHHCTRSEFDFINSIRQKAIRRERLSGSRSSLVSHHSALIHGIGDDAAVFGQRAGFDSIVTADLLVEDVDFRLTTTTPRLLGHKALAVSLSDVAAMGGRARFALLSVGVPREVWRSNFLDRFYEGFFALADRSGVLLIGGDVSRTPERIVIDSIVIGEAERGAARFRSGARPGDHIFVTGNLGGSAVGLLLLENEAEGRRAGRQSRLLFERAIRRHRRPEPRLSWGALLGEERLATAMIDLSDGLSSDLSHLCRESRVGAIVDARRIPVDPLAEQLADLVRLDPMEAALNGGEDFELLFTIHPRDLPRLPRSVGGVPATYIGDVTDRRDGVLLRQGRSLRRLTPRGFMHF
ncbi:MAG TPA: thiamine-phosphate kinase [Pyrinomonadaceae bacterium]|nr:thiamine-phosphate kinase [Pyrinomonadaceae bacterium]